MSYIGKVIGTWTVNSEPDEKDMCLVSCSCGISFRTPLFRIVYKELGFCEACFNTHHVVDDIFCEPEQIIPGSEEILPMIKYIPLKVNK